MKKLAIGMEEFCTKLLACDDSCMTDICIYGSGHHMHGYVFMFQFLSYWLAKNNKELTGSFIDKITAVVDNDQRKHGKEVSFGLRTFFISPPQEQMYSELKESDCNVRNKIFVITATRYAGEMEKTLQKVDDSKNNSYIVASELRCNLANQWPRKFFRQLMRNWADQYTYADIPELVDKLRSWLRTDLTILPEIALKLTNKCTLNCRNCIDRVPFMEKRDVPFAEVEKDLNLLIENSAYIGRLTFITGETLVYPHLKQVLEMIVDNSKVKQIFFNTNGTVLPAQAVVPYLQSKKCLIHISDYGDIVRMARAVDFYERNEIEFFISSEMKWKDVGRYPKQRNLDVELLKREYEACGVGNACPPVLSSGKLFPCAIACWFYELGEYKGTKDYAELRNLPKEEFKRKLYEIIDTDYLECCDMCDVSVYGNLPENIDAGIQIDTSKQWHRSKYTICPRIE